LAWWHYTQEFAPLRNVSQSLGVFLAPVQRPRRLAGKAILAVPGAVVRQPQFSPNLPGQPMLGHPEKLFHKVLDNFKYRAHTGLNLGP
jgi:hypothetical protein